MLLIYMFKKFLNTWFSSNNLTWELSTYCALRIAYQNHSSFIVKYKQQRKKTLLLIRIS
jgi:hypothetical protein